MSSINKYFKILLAIIFLIIVIFIGIGLVNYKINKDHVNFISSPKYEYMSKEAYRVGDLYCVDVGVKQVGFDVDNEHVHILCRDGDEIVVRIREVEE